MPTTETGMLRRLFPEIAVDKENAKARWAYVILYAIIFSAVVFVLRSLNIARSSGITDLAVIFIPGFIVQSLIPVRYRPFVYCLVFVASLGYVFSWPTTVVILFFLSLTAFVIFSAVKLKWKYVYLIVLGIAFYIMRNTFLVQMPRLNMAVPFMAAILMFRVIILMYEVKYNKLPENHWIKLSYFFCFPNLAFLFFPIIDYKTYVRGYYAEPFEDTCNKAFYYMITGILFLVAHKVLGFYIDITYAGVHDVYTLFLYILSKYILVFKMIGLLTLGLSFICMFGFSMPLLFANFFIVTSFNNYWQRVNIYWKDFIAKIVYYPIYFKYRKKVKSAAPIFVFFAVLSSWFFHLYQQFWISGILVLRAQDFLYWLILALLVSLSVYAGERNLKKETEPVTIGPYLVKGIRFVVVFLGMQVCWVLWNSDDLSAFSYVMSRGMHASGQQLMSAAAMISLAIVCFAYYSRNSDRNYSPIRAKTRWRTSLSLVTLCLLCAIGLFSPQLSKSQLVAVISSARETSRDEHARKEIDYYSSVTGIKNSWEVGLAQNDNHTLFGQIGNSTNSLLFQEMNPNQHKKFKGQLVTSNSYGLRDKEYSLQKPVGTYRIALLGGSYEMGSGVSDEHVFEKVLEDSLNAYLGGKIKIEILNFAMGSFTTVPQMEVLRTKVLAFQPDEVMVFYHTDEMGRATRFFARYISNAIDLKYDYLLNVKERSGVKQSMSNEETIARLSPYMEGVTAWAYMQMDSICKTNNIKQVAIFLPTTDDPFTEAKVNDWKRFVEPAGFSAFVLRDVYEGVDHRNVIVSEDDQHPNALGHRLIANKLFNLLTDSTSHIIPLK